MLYMYLIRTNVTCCSISFTCHVNRKVESISKFSILIGIICFPNSNNFHNMFLKIKCLVNIFKNQGYLKKKGLVF